MTDSKFEAIASFPNFSTLASKHVVNGEMSMESLEAMRAEFAALDFNPADVMLLSSKFITTATYYDQPDDLFYYVWREPKGIFGAAVWGNQIVPERIDQIRVEPRKVIEQMYFRPGKNTPVGTRVFGLAT